MGIILTTVCILYQKVYIILTDRILKVNRILYQFAVVRNKVHSHIAISIPVQHHKLTSRTHQLTIHLNFTFS